MGRLLVRPNRRFPLNPFFNYKQRLVEALLQKTSRNLSPRTRTESFHFKKRRVLRKTPPIERHAFPSSRIYRKSFQKLMNEWVETENSLRRD